MPEETTRSGFSQFEDSVIKETVKQFQGLLTRNWSQVMKERDESEESSCGIGFAVSFQKEKDVVAIRSKLTVKRNGIIEESESVVIDPNQQRFGFEGGGGE